MNVERVVKENQGLGGQMISSVLPLFSKMFSKITTWIGLLVVFLFFCLPILKLILLSFVSNTGFSLENYIELFREENTWRTISNTFILACSSTVIALFLGVFTAWLIAYSNFRGKKFFQAVVLLTFLIPSYILTLSWTQFFEADGLLARCLSFIFGQQVEPWSPYSFGGMIFMMGLHHYPLVYLLSLSGFRKIPRDLEWASRNAGVGRWKTFCLVNVPLAAPGIVSGGLLAFIASLDNFGIPAFLGIPAHISVISTSIYEELNGFGPAAIARAASLSTVLGLFALMGTGFHWLLNRKFRQFESIREDRDSRFTFGKYKVVIEIVVWGILIVISFVPLFSMGFQSFLKAYGVPIRWGNLTWDNYKFILLENGKVQNSILNSLFLSLTSVLICLVIGTGIAYFRIRKPSFFSRTLELMVGIPYALPGVVFAIAMILTWMEPVPGWNPGIYGSITILLMAYVGRFLILQVRGSMTTLLQVDRALEEASHICGVGGIRKWRRILLPLILPGMLNGALLVFLTSLTELTVSSLLSSSGSETIGVVIFNYEQAGSTMYSTALSNLIVMVIFLAAICYFSIQKFFTRKEC